MAPDAPFWFETIAHRGRAAYHRRGAAYTVFRNVRDFGAVGDGATDDTAAIMAAMASGGRCGGGKCESTTVSPAIVYFPRGSYLVSSPIIAYYYTQIVGDATDPPTIIASPDFAGIALVDGDPYLPGGANWYTNQNNFFRSVRNLVLDLRRMPAQASATGLHWQVSQATSLQNIRVEMNDGPDTMHQGMFMENGSPGGFMGDLTFNGGRYGMWLGNQQFTVRNVTINRAKTAIWAQWNWGWTFQSIFMNDCAVGFDLFVGGTTKEEQGVGAEAIIDAVATDVPVFVRTSKPRGGSLVLQNAVLRRCATAVGSPGEPDALPGDPDGEVTIRRWARGRAYTGTRKEVTMVEGPIAGGQLAPTLLDRHGRVVSRPRPQYEFCGIDEFVSVRAEGAVGDGETDDTKALQAVIDKYAATKIIFIDHGTYLLTNTLRVPAHARIVGEAWAVLLGGGPAFGDARSPRPVVRLGAPGERGAVEISDVIFATRGPAPGAIVLQINVSGAGLWDSHIRLGGAMGTNLEAPEFAAGTCKEEASAAFLGLHLSPTSSAYLEGTWVWLADHELDGDGKTQLTLFSGRGILSESHGPVWMIGTGAEHHVLYQYMLRGARDHYMGLIQTETAYFQPNPPAPRPFQRSVEWHDPLTDQQMGWGLWVENSQRILVFGAGLYCFFSAYSQEGLERAEFQLQIANIDAGSDVEILSLSTVGTTWMLTVEQDGVVHRAPNAAGFAATMTCWTRG